MRAVRKLERIFNSQHIVNHLAVLQVFRNQTSTTAFECGGDDEAVVKGESVALGDAASVVNGRGRVDVEGVVSGGFVQHGSDVGPSELEFFVERVGRFLQDLCADSAVLGGNDLLSDLLFAQIKVGVGVDDNVRV